MSDLERITKAVDKMSQRQQWQLAGFIEGYTERVKEEQAEKDTKKKEKE